MSIGVAVADVGPLRYGGIIRYPKRLVVALGVVLVIYDMGHVVVPGMWPRYPRDRYSAVLIPFPSGHEAPSQ